MSALERMTSEARNLGEVETVQVPIHVVRNYSMLPRAQKWGLTDLKRSTSQLTASAERPFPGEGRLSGQVSTRHRKSGAYRSGPRSGRHERAREPV